MEVVGLPYLQGRQLEAGLVVGGVEQPDGRDDLQRAHGEVQQAVQPRGEGQAGRAARGEGHILWDVLHQDHPVQTKFKGQRSKVNQMEEFKKKYLCGDND